MHLGSSAYGGGAVCTAQHDRGVGLELGYRHPNSLKHPVGAPLLLGIERLTNVDELRHAPQYELLSTRGAWKVCQRRRAIRDVRGAPRQRDGRRVYDERARPVEDAPWNAANDRAVPGAHEVAPRIDDRGTASPHGVTRSLACQLCCGNDVCDICDGAREGLGT